MTHATRSFLLATIQRERPDVFTIQLDLQILRRNGVTEDLPATVGELDAALAELVAEGVIQLNGGHYSIRVKPSERQGSLWA